MLKNYRTTLFIAIVFLSVSSAFAQNRFEGYNLFLDVPETHKVATCALRYVSPQTEITITDLNRATPMRLSNCGDATTQLAQRGANTVLRGSSTNYKWCFTGEDKMYRVTFKGDEYAGQVTYNWIPDSQTTGTYNVKDFGAVGDGATDDTIAFKSAVAFIASRNGGTLQIPEGDFVITSPVTLVSGLNIQGVSSLPTTAPTNNVVGRSPSRIKLRGKNLSLFRIGECTESIAVKDVELFAESNENTNGIEAVGAFSSSQNFYFERVVFHSFNRGFYAHGLMQTNLAWQFDFIKFNHCRFVYNRDAGIYSNVINSTWKIQSSFFNNPPFTPTAKADSMNFERAGGVLIQDTFGGGFLSARGGVFLNILDTTITTIIGSQTESTTASIVYNEVKNPSAGDYSYPLNIINSVFGDPIIFNARRTLVSVGSLYGPKTFQADERLRVYSTGDRFCYDGITLGCQSPAQSNKFDRATVIFMTGQPGEGTVQGHPTLFGTDVQFGMPVQMPSFLQTALPTGKANGTMIYCSNCRRNTTPCQSGGTGAPAMVVNSQWSCL
ncbi:MAG: glycoside hydrolase family 55 protein [Pyrinomonadaceae bacterium]|nr:glycoside hydrolase family 55 protein [Pyrinomonadaceae bacterium]